MAAPPSKPSPSNKEVQQTDTQEPAVSLKDPPPAASSLKDPPPAAAAAASLKDPPPTTKDETSAPILSYEHSESSDYYVLAKQLLAEGDFEQALTAIEQGIEESKVLLFSVGVQNVDLHESIAPFHYMYGTTLLYSIEESNDTQVTVDGAAQQTQTTEVPEAAAASAAPQEAEQEEAAPAEAAAADNDNADDMHIAWENLEVARTIVEELLVQDDTISQTFKSKLQLDLAQIMLREGDLQRLNGRYSEAIQDYQACLKLRKLLLPQFDRKIADAQYNLGLSYLSKSSELQKLQETATTTTTTTSPDIQTISEEHCHKGMELYVECARTLCGVMALLCGVEPSTVLTTTSEQGGFKTTGLLEEEGTTTTNSSDASQMLSVWRKNVSTLVAGGEVVEDLKELLDEIQETVDEAEKSQDAVRQAVQIKVQMQKAIDREDEQDESGGGTTTIGFDKPTLSTTEAAVTTTTGQKPMMVVKKKKKRDLPVEDDDSKPAAEDAKRAKTD
jgi:tetratricopeptide (TPR) repeat protein